MPHPCVLCDQEVRPRQHALECESCFQWQHRLCNTGVSAADYRRLINDEIEIIFHCVNCTEIGDPIHPADELNTDYLKCNDFLLADLRVDDQRHLLFATQFQLQLLKQTKRWFMDGTFKVVAPPFKNGNRGQLFTINCFVQIDNKMKQFPLFFAIMSRKTEEDYDAIFQHLKDRLVHYAVEGFVVDFEKGLWLSLRQQFPGLPVKGCVFHWQQAVWRHVQSCGLVRTYREHQTMYRYIKQLMALPFLPSGHIVQTFDALMVRANSAPLREFVQYIQRQWIQNQLHPVQCFNRQYALIMMLRGGTTD